MKATILDLRRRMSEVLKALDRNEPVTIYHRGKKKGILYPVGSAGNKKGKVVDHPAFGMWKDREDLKDIDQAVREMRKDRPDAV